MKYDLGDPLIRGMIDTEHRPTETFDHNGYVYYLKEIKCKRCKEDWPCHAQQLLRARRETLREDPS